MRKFGPKSAGHPSIGDKCPVCLALFREGDFTTLIPLGPADNPKDRKRARENRAYTAIAKEVHWACATGEEE